MERTTWETTEPFKALKGAKYLSLTTFRKTGKPVPTPVWFAQRNYTLYISTAKPSGKVKRLRNNPKVTIAPCTGRGQVTGSVEEANARFVTDPQELKVANQVLAKKYGLARRTLYLMVKIVQLVQRKPSVEQVYLAVEEG
ncbi:MAG: PPOX class F420-dependent oxidoreductase [Chloroflexota bacterium]|nr:PPOX class F420-dependent oxidoreductase [Chloroflexota bacterium]